MKIKRFDKIEYQVLTSAHPSGMGYYPNDPQKKRALLLMKEGILVKTPYEKWSDKGWKLTDEGLKYHDEFIKQLYKKHGHVWETYSDDVDNIDYFALSEGYHNGPRCKKCGYMFCHHCTSEFDINKCVPKPIIIRCCKNGIVLGLILSVPIILVALFLFKFVA